MAEREGFEPSVEFPLHTLSRRAPSTTRTSLRVYLSGIYSVCRLTLMIILQIKRICKYFFMVIMAERVGFEPTRRFTAYSISSRAPSTSSATSPGIPYGVSETSCVCFFLRRCRKKSRIICAHSSALTPAVTAIRWFKASFCAILKRDSTAPAFTSALP